MVNLNLRSINVKVDLEFYEGILKKIIEQEKERGNICSNPNATRILYKRIIKAGGLKE